MLETGCRPNEAAYLVLENSFTLTSAAKGCDYMAIVPAHKTKTGDKYKWAMKRKVNKAVKLVQELHERDRLGTFKSQHHLAKVLFDWFTRRILPDAAKESKVVKAHLDSNNKYNLRTVRSRFATAWAAAKLAAESKGEKPPKNPLFHKSSAVTFRCYVALEDSDDKRGYALNPFNDPDQDIYHEHDSEVEVEASTAPGKRAGGRTIYVRRTDKGETKMKTKLLKAITEE